MFQLKKYFSSFISNKASLGFIVFLCAISLSSCFTGIESTKKINLSREDKKLSNPTAEEKFMASIQGLPLKEWEQGKRFIAADDKALLVIVPQEGLTSTPPDNVKGKILVFNGVQSKMNPAGILTVVLLFTDGTYLYAYDTGKDFDGAMENVMSDQIPMLIDESMVENARNLLVDKKVFTRSPLWYDEEGNRIDGRKFVEVTILEVQPGDLVFPLNLKIEDDKGGRAYILMNFGTADNDSRAFQHIFSLTDPKKHYPNIDKETWEYITQGKVKEGMTKEEVKLALGNPKEISSGHDYSQTLDIWQFDNGRLLWFEDGRLVKIRQ